MREKGVNSLRQADRTKYFSLSVDFPICLPLFKNRNVIRIRENIILKDNLMFPLQQQVRALRGAENNGFEANLSSNSSKCSNGTSGE